MERRYEHVLITLGLRCTMYGIIVFENLHFLYVHTKAINLRFQKSSSS